MACLFPKFRKTAGTVVACGQCVPCLLKKQREKVARVLLEDHSRDSAERPLFITLTYDQAHLPLSYVHETVDPDSGEIIEELYSCPTGTLVRTAVPDFMKRLRARARGFKLRAAYAGEYGDDFKRPHYHLILWGLPYDRRELIFRSWVDKKKNLMCDPARLDIQIPNNERHVANYCSAYIMNGKKKSGSPLLNGAFPEFYCTSKGLGLSYVDGIVSALTTPSGLANLWIAGKIPSSFFFDGKNYPLDRYLRSKIYEKLPRVFQEELPKAALEEYKEEVFSVYQDQAAASPSSFELMGGISARLESAMRLKNAASGLDVEKRHFFFKSKRKRLDV